MANFKLNSVTVASETGGTVTLDSGILFPVGHIIKIHAFHDQSTVTVAANGTGSEIIDQDFTALGASSAYYFCADIATCGDIASGNSDAGDRGFTAWLEDSGAGNKYRFGYRKTSGTRHAQIVAANDYYALWDSDGGNNFDSTWHQDQHSFSWIPGNQSSDDTTTVVNSAFTAGSTVTLKVWLASQNGCYYNSARGDGGTAGTAGSASHSHFSVIEVAT